jgi:predicted permease
MTLLHRFRSVIRWLLHREKAEQALDQELQTYIDLSASDKIRDGVPPAEARRLAALELGGLEQVKERVRTRRHGALLDALGGDLRYAFRMFAKNRGVMVVIVLTLALGIGANTAIFSLIDALMLRWLPVPNPHELVQLRLHTPGARPSESFSYPLARALADQKDIFAGVAGFSGFSFNVGPPGSVNRVGAAVVTGNFFETLGLKPIIGRLLRQEDDEPEAPLVAVISYGYWERQFARNPGTVGQAIVMNGVPVTIVGVSPRGFTGANVGSNAGVTIAAAALPQISPQSRTLLEKGNIWLRVLARPKEGVSIPAAEQRLAALWPEMSEDVISPTWPPFLKKAMAEGVFEIVPGGTGWTYLRQIYRKPLLVLMALVALVLLIACANVASLLLARASARQREIAMRLAIGAGRGRIMRQLMTESLLLSFIGAVFGLLLAWWSGRFLVNMISSGPAPVEFDLTPNWHVLAFASAIATATAILFGVVPAVQATAYGRSLVLTESARMTGSRSRLLFSLVCLQVTLSLLLLIGAGLFVRTLQNLQSLDPGFNHEGVLLVDLEGRRTAISPELLDEVRKLPGVLSASLSTHTPLSGAVWSDIAVPKGQPIPERDTAFMVGAGPRFFETMQIRLLSGRDFTDHDSTGNPDVAVVNEAFAKRFFPNQNAVGQILSAVVRSRRTDLEIVGLVKDTNAGGLRVAPPSTVYVSYAQLSGNFPSTLEIRAGGSISQVATTIRQTLQQKLPSEPIEVRPLSAQVEATITQERMLATLASAFGALALLLSAIGLYGLLAYSVAQRTKEMGIRMALGAHAGLLIVMVLKSAIRPVLIGMMLGLPAAWAASRWVESMLFGLEPADSATIGAAMLLLITASLLAAYLPARRASRVDPLVTLRHE